MATGLITHPDCLKHEVPSGHPERPARLSEILRLLDAPEFSGVIRKEAPRADVAAIMRAHSEEHVFELLDSIPISVLSDLIWILWRRPAAERLHFGLRVRWSLRLIW